MEVAAAKQLFTLSSFFVTEQHELTISQQNSLLTHLVGYIPLPFILARYTHYWDPAGTLGTKSTLV